MNDAHSGRPFHHLMKPWLAARRKKNGPAWGPFPAMRRQGGAFVFLCCAACAALAKS
jgi:hypothetical protein